MNDSDMLHHLLPWFVNETLSSGERRAFEAHLDKCAACQREEQTLLKLRSEIEHQGGSLFEDHPSSQTLVGFVRDELAEAEAGRVRRHLLVCGTCTLERRWVSGDPAGQKVGALRRSQGRALRRLILPLAAAAALLLAVVLWPIARQAGGGAGTGLMDVFFLDSAARSVEPPVIEVADGSQGFTLFLQVDALPEELPLDLIVTDSAGGEVYRGVQEGSLVRDTYLALYCDRQQFPDGQYLVRLRRQAAQDAPWTEFPFRVVTQR